MIALGPNLSTELAVLYVGGALLATCSWTGVAFDFFRRDVPSASITLATVPARLVHQHCRD